VDAAEYCDGSLDDACELDISLAIPFVSTATLVLKEYIGDTGDALAGATVEWYEVDEANGKKFYLVGRSVSDDEGRVTGLLPPTFQSVAHQP
jgi:hypothetical protein